MSGARGTLVARLGVLAVRVGFGLGRLRPVRAHVVLGGAEGARQAGNLLYIRRELERRTPRIPVRFARYQTRPGVRGRIMGAADALRAGYHLASARLFVVQDSFFPMDAITPRRGTLRVQVWHAAGAFKKFGYSELDATPADDLGADRLVPLHANYDLCLVSSSSAVVHYMDAFRLPRDQFTAALGLPRTDLFFDQERGERAAEAIRRRYALPDGRKVLLYAPTFRGDPVHDPRFDESLDLARLRDALAPDWVVLLRLHPLVRQSARLTPDLAGFVIDVSAWPDLNELMLVADLLVTDYSSAIFEFALLGRPMALFAPDLDVYERERGFYFDVRTGVPGPVFETSRGLADYVAAGRFDLEPVRAFAGEWFDVADGHASERFVDRVVLPALRGEAIRAEVASRPIGRAGAPPEAPPSDGGSPAQEPRTET